MKIRFKVLFLFLLRLKIFLKLAPKFLLILVFFGKKMVEISVEIRCLFIFKIYASNFMFCQKLIRLSYFSVKSSYVTCKIGGRKFSDRLVPVSSRSSASFLESHFEMISASLWGPKQKKGCEIGTNCEIKWQSGLRNFNFSSRKLERILVFSTQKRYECFQGSRWGSGVVPFFPGSPWTLIFRLSFWSWIAKVGVVRASKV